MQIIFDLNRIVNIYSGGHVNLATYLYQKPVKAKIHNYFKKKINV